MDGELGLEPGRGSEEGVAASNQEPRDFMGKVTLKLGSIWTLKDLAKA